MGSGGREHSLGWKLSQSTNVDKIFYAPGNGGTEENIPIDVTDIEQLSDFAAKNDCFTIVGPEAPLASGIVDFFKNKKLKIFGPTQNAAQLESSKIWAKNFMKKHDIPTARFEIFDDADDAKKYLESVTYSVVIKADGLAAGKGVIVCDSKSEALAAIDSMLIKKTFGIAGTKIIIEEKLDGVEASYIALCDGKIAIPMATSQDHKRVYDGDNGPNTGGMGAYSPTPVISDSLKDIIQKQIIDKTISSLSEEGILFKGFLYAGIMIRDGLPYVLEYNVRMGDPECQPIMMRMNSDLFAYVQASYSGNLSSLPPISWTPQSAVCIVLASKGYPESYPKNELISGLDMNEPNSFVFHAGTKNDSGKIVTNGGRVLGVTALGETLSDAIKNAYTVTQKISWPNKFCRTDIGKKGLSTSP